MKKIMGHLTGKLSLSILSVIVLLVGLLAGMNGITSVKAGGESPSASAVQASSKAQASPSKVSAAPVAINASASAARVTTVAADTPSAAIMAAAAAGKPADKSVTKEAATHAMNKLPLLIEPNRGQTDSKVKFVARSMGYQAFLTGPATAMLEYRPNEKDSNKSVDFLTMKLAGANTAAAAEPLEPTGGVSNYILGADSSKWITNVPHYSKLRYGNVYPGIDVIYQGDNSRFRYDFKVNPGADPKAIQIAYEGGKGLSLDKDGNAVVNLGSGRMIASKPVIFQEYGGQKHSVDGAYVLTASNTVAFQVGAYDKSQALVIDPSDTYAAYYGFGATATFNTVFNGVAMDNINGIYMTGWTSDLGITATGSPTAGIVGVIVVAPIDLTKIGTITAFGATPATQTGSSFTVGNGVAAFGGNAFVVGVTNAGSNWAAAPAAATALEASTFNKVPNVNPHAFLIKFTNGAGAPPISTLLYGSGTEFASSVAVEQTGLNAGRVHITGGTTSGTSVGTPGPSTFLLNLPMTTGASAPYQLNQSSSNASTNAFYLVTNKTQTSVDYATLFGGYNQDFGAAVAVDQLGQGYIVGTSDSFGAGTVVGIQDGTHTPAPELTNGPTGPNSALTSQFMFVNPQGAGCPISPVVAFLPPVPPPTFFGIPMPAEGTAIVSHGSVVGISLTSAGAGYDPVNESFVPFTILGCLGGVIPGFGVVQNVPGGTSANNLPIPSDTLLVLNPGTLYNPLAPPIITFTGGGCAVEPTASSIVSITAPFGLTQMVLNTPGTGCTSAPTVTIQAPPTIAGEAAGFQATAVYIPGTQPIGIDQSGAVPAKFHAFIAKFNGNVVPAPFGPLPGIATLSYGFAIGNILATNADHVAIGPGLGNCILAGNTNSVPPPASTGLGGLLPISVGNVPLVPVGGDATIGECETGTAVAVDQYGNAYIGGDTVVPVLNTAPAPPTPGIFNGNLTNAVFSSPGVAGGELNSITVTAAGIGYGPAGTIPVFFDFTHDINGGCYINPAALATLDSNGSVLFITITNPGFGCTSIPGIGIQGNNGIGFHGIAALATALAGNTGNDGANTTGNLATGWVMEVVSNQVINNGLTTTSTQDGIPLGPHSPSSVAAFPAMIYATNVRGDENCAPCIAPGIAGGFGNGAGTLPAAPPAGTLAAPNNFDSVVTGIAVDALGQAYVSGATSYSLVPTAAAPADDALMLRRRINAKGFPSNPLPLLPNAAQIEAANTQFLSTFPAIPNTGPSNIVPNTGLTPFGSVELGVVGATPPNAGAFLGMAFEPTTLTSCSVGYIEDQVSALDASGTGIFPNGTQSQPAVFTGAKTYLGTAPTADGFVACTQFQDDIVVGTGCVSGVNCNPVSNPTPTSLIFTMPAGTRNKLPSGASNVEPAGVFPSALTVNGTLDGSLPTGASVNLSNITQVYYQGRTADAPGTGPNSSGAPDILWLFATPFGSSIQLSLVDPNPLSLRPTPASFLDPGIYYCLVTVVPTLTGGVADNANIPQTIIVTLNVTGMLEINTTVGGGIPATGTNPTTGAITVALQQGGAATGSWNISNGGTLDAAGNLVLNIPVWSDVPLNSPTHSHFIYLVNQGGLAPPATNETALPLNYAGPLPQTFIGSGVTAGSLVSPFQILGTGLNTANQNLFFTTGFNIPVGATTGGVFLTPAFAAISNPGGGVSNDVVYLPPGATDCSPNFVNPPDTRDPTSKGGANDTVCYIQVILPPTILQGAPTGAYTVNLQLQSVPNLTNPETPVRSDTAFQYIDYSVPYLSQNNPTPNATAAPYVENFCVGATQCGPALTATSYDVVPPPAATVIATIPITVNVSPGPLIINSPWVSNNITHCLTAPAAGPGLFFSVPECNTNSPTIPLAPFTVPTGWIGLVTSNINSSSNGNNPANTYNNVVLDTRNLGLSAPSTFTASYTGGLSSISLGEGVTVPALQVMNDYMVYQLFNTPTIYPNWVVPTCTTSSPAIPAGVIQFPASGVLPISTPGFSTTAFTIGINTAGVTPALTNGFYAGVITVTPNGSATQASQIPVCLEVGNNIIPQYETIPQPFTVPPPYDPTGNIVPPSGLIIEAGNTQYVQVIANVLGPNQQPPISGTQTFGTPSFVAIPVSITPSPSNPSFVMPLVAPLNIGNEFSIVPLGTITEGINTATNCSLITGAPNGPCLTDAYMDFVIAANSATTPGQPVVVNFSFTDSQPMTSLLWGTDPPPPLNVIITSGPTLVYTPTPNTIPTNGVLAYITLLPSPPLGLFGGAGYTSVPNITFHSGCTTEPTAIATISQPGASGFVSGITVTNPGAGCSSIPVITIDPPSTPGGLVALAQAFISNGVLSYSFNQVVNTPSASSTSCQTTTPGGACVGPLGSSFQAITVQASTAGIGVVTPSALAGTVYYNPPAGILNLAGWLDIASVNCLPILVNPTPLTECEFTLSTNANVSLLQTGTYQAYAQFLAVNIPPNTEPAVVSVLVTLNVTNQATVTTTGLATGIAAFGFVIGGSTTTPPSQATNLSVNALPSGVTGIPFTATATSSTAPPNCPAPCAFIELNGGTAPLTGNLTTSPIPVSISINPALLQFFNVPGQTFTGVVTVTTPSSMTSNPTLTIPVTLIVSGQPAITLSDGVDPTVHCGTANAAGNTSCTATAAFTIGQDVPDGGGGAAPPFFTTQINLGGSTPDTLNITSNVPWLIPSLASTTQAITPLTISIDPTKISPLAAGPIVGIITVKGVNGPEVATFTVTLTVANPPTITMTAIAPQVVAFGTAAFNVTTNVGLSVAPANPTTLPVSCTVTGGSSWLSVGTGNPTSLSATAAPFTFVVNPGTTPQPVGTFSAGKITCITTGGITPAITNNISVSLTVNGSLNDTTPSGTSFGSYTIGNPPPTLPLGIWSSPTGATVSIASSATWLSVSTTPVTAGTQAAPTMVTVSIVTSDPAITGAANGATLTANLTLTAPQSFLDCATPTGTGTTTGLCTVVIPFTVTVLTSPAITTNPASGSTITFNLPTLAGAPGSDSNANMNVAVIAKSGNTLQAVPFIATPTVVTPAGGTWLGATGGTTTASGPAANSDVMVTVGSLAQGTYAGSVAFAAASGSTGAQGQSNVGVLLNVGTLAVSGGPVSFFHQFGVTNPATSTLQVSAGPAAINWVASVTPNTGTPNCNWLIPGALSGTTPNNGSNAVSVSYSVAGLPDANAVYNCTINYAPAPSYGASAADTVPVLVTLTTSINPVWVVTPNTTQTEFVQLGATTAPGVVFQIAASSILAPATTITATVTPFPNNPFGTGPNLGTPIFTATPTTLTVPAAPGSVGLTINANPAGLPVGTYQGSFSITSPAITGTAVVTVDLVVTASCQFVVSPTGAIALTNAVPSSGTPVTVTGSFTVTPNSVAVCGGANPSTWMATSNASWLIITSGNTGNGNASGGGTYEALSNPTTSARTATVTFTPSVGVLSVIQFTQPGSTAPTQLRQVTALYQSILGRDPETAGYVFWTGQGATALGQMVDAFTTSPESFNTNFGVMAAYQAATGASPNLAEFTAHVLQVRLGGTTVPGLFTTLSAGVTGFSATNLYQNLLNRAPSTQEANACNGNLANCFATIIGFPASATPVGPGSSNEFLSTGTFANHTASCTTGTCTVPGDHTNSLYVHMLYFTILGRDPDSGGLQFWLGIANGGGAGVLFQGPAEQTVRIQILGPGTVNQGFVGSPEFQALFQ